MVLFRDSSITSLWVKTFSAKPGSAAMVEKHSPGYNVELQAVLTIACDGVERTLSAAEFLRELTPATVVETRSRLVRREKKSFLFFFGMGMRLPELDIPAKSCFNL